MGSERDVRRIEKRTRGDGSGETHLHLHRCTWRRVQDLRDDPNVLSERRAEFDSGHQHWRTVTRGARAFMRHMMHLQLVAVEMCINAKQFHSDVTLLKKHDV